MIIMVVMQNNFRLGTLSQVPLSVKWDHPHPLTVARKPQAVRPHRAEAMSSASLLTLGPRGSRRMAGGNVRGGVTWGSPQTDLLFGGIQVLRSCLEKLQHLITLRDVRGQLDQGLRQR